MLLWYHILRRSQFLHALVPTADALCRATIGVGLEDVAEKGAGGEISIDSELQTQLGQCAEFTIGRHQVAQLQLAIFVSLHYLLQANGGSVGGGQEKQHFHLSLTGADTEHTGFQLIKALPGASTHGVGKVVLRRRTPEVPPQRTGQHLATLETIGGHAAVGSAEGDTELVATKGNAMLVTVKLIVLRRTCHRGHTPPFWVVEHTIASTGIDSLHLGGMGVRGTVGGEDAVGAESVVVLDARQLTQVAAGSPTKLRIEN